MEQAYWTEVNVELESCRYLDCKNKPRPDLFYCPSCWKILFARIQQDLATVNKQAHHIYIGRSNFPEERLLYHRRDYGETRLSVLHWASSQAEAAKLETVLIDYASEFGKSVEQDVTSFGSWKGHFHSIYVLWEPKNSSSWDTSQDHALPVVGAGSTLSLDEGARIFPRRAGEFETVHIVTKANQRSAERILDNLKAMRKKVKDD
jgi:hypothetical protein